MTETTIVVENCLQRLREGDLQARDELVARISRRLLTLAERMLQDYPRVARWEQVEDLFQQAAIRLHQSLAKTIPTSVEGFLGLAALQLRRELCDMTRHYYGANGHGTHQVPSGHKLTPFLDVAECQEAGNSSLDPEKLARWTEFHAVVETLPEEERQVVDLLWYHELSQVEAAKLMQVSERQLRRYWQSARLMLQKRLGDSGL